MTRNDIDRPAHEVPVSVWVGKRGIEAVSDELADQLAAGDPVKVKFLRSARSGTDDSVAALADRLADRTGSVVLDQRGHTAVFRRE